MDRSQAALHRLKAAIDDPEIIDEKPLMQMVNRELLNVKRLDTLCRKLNQNQENEPSSDLNRDLAGISGNLSALVREIDGKFNTHYSPWFSLKLGPPNFTLKPRKLQIREPPVEEISREISSTVPLATKSLMANERTFLSWVNVWLALATFSVSSVSVSSISVSVGFGIAACFGIWISFFYFISRAQKIKQRLEFPGHPILFPGLVAALFWSLAYIQI